MQAGLHACGASIDDVPHKLACCESSSIQPPSVHTIASDGARTASIKTRSNATFSAMHLSEHPYCCSIHQPWFDDMPINLLCCLKCKGVSCLLVPVWLPWKTHCFSPWWPSGCRLPVCLQEAYGLLKAAIQEVSAGVSSFCGILNALSLVLGRLVCSCLPFIIWQHEAIWVFRSNTMLLSPGQVCIGIRGPVCSPL